MRKVNKTTIELVKSFEGLFLKPYLCPAGIPTIGFGSISYPNGQSVILSDPAITEEQATEYLQFEINEKAAGVEKMVSEELTDNEFGALVSFAYNLGLGSLHGSTLLKLLNAGKDTVDREAVGDQFLRWNKADGKVLAGLTRRRQAERALFLQPDQDSSLLPDGPSDEDIKTSLSQVEADILDKS